MKEDKIIEGGVPTINEVIHNAKFFVNDVHCGVECYTDRRKDNSGWNGYAIKLKYLHEIGYYYDLTMIGTSANLIEQEFVEGKETITKDVNVALKWLGNCPKCNQELWSTFSWEFHNVNNCGNKKAVRIN